MNYWAQTFAYLKKHFWLPLVVMLVPAVAACLLSTPYYEVSFVAAFDYDPYRSIGETFAIIFGDSWRHGWRVVIISALQVLGSSLVISAVDRHFRTGLLSLKTPIRLLNYSIFPIFISFAVMCMVSIVERFVLFGLVMLVQVIFKAASFGAVAGLAVISLIAVALFLAHVIIITSMMYWAPVMFVYGYRFRDAAAASFKLLARQKAHRGIVFPLVICAGLQLLVGFLQVHPAISCAVNFVVFMFTNVYVCVYVILSFYKICKLERRDVLPYENLSLPMTLPDDKKTDEKNAKNAKSAKSAKTKDTKNANNAKSSKTDNVENADDTERDKSHNGAVKPERKQKPKKKRGGEGDDVDQKRR